MQIFQQVKQLQLFIEKAKSEKKNIGFVPTMGALHLGHISLIEQAKLENDIVICSIFVNPTQFNDKRDLENYPRPIEADIHLLKHHGCDVLFNPDVNEIFPDYSNQETINIASTTIDRTSNKVELFKENTSLILNSDQNTNISFEKLDDLELNGIDMFMEGKFRPGHFKGVIKVVYRLFDIIKPTVAYFGQKDFQQFAIIKQMAENLKLNLKLKSCPIIREENGLAMSSRNMLLSADHKQLASFIYKTLLEAKELSHKWSAIEVKEFVENQIGSMKEMQLEYFEIVDSKTLKSITKWQDTTQAVGCIALFLGKIRLIDNIIF